MAYHMKLVMQPNGKYHNQLVDDGKGPAVTNTTAPAAPHPPVLPNPALGVGNGAVGTSTPANQTPPIHIAPTPPAHAVGATPAAPPPIHGPAQPAAQTPAYLRVYQRDPKTNKYLIIKKATARMTPEELKNAQMSGLNKNANPFAPQIMPPDPIRHPTLGPATGADDGSGFYFNPASDTLWSYRSADGTETLNATLPADTDNAHYLDSHDSGLPGGALQKDAAWYTSHNSSAKALSDALSGPRSNLAGFDKLYDDGADDNNPHTGRTLAARGLAQNSHDFNVNTDAAMSDLAQRGWLQSGARGLTAADLVKQLSDANLATEQSVGSIARQNAQTQIGQARDSYTTNLMQSLSQMLANLHTTQVSQAAAT